MSVKSQTAAVNTNGGLAYWNQTMCPHQEAYVKVTTIDPTAEEVFLLFKGQDALGCNALEVVYDFPSASLAIWSCASPGSWKNLKTMPHPLSNGDVLGGRVDAQGNVEAYINGALKLSTNVGAWPYGAQGGLIGFGWFKGSGSGRLDDFGGGPVAP